MSTRCPARSVLYGASAGGPRVALRDWAATLLFDTATFWVFFALAWGAWRLLPFRAAKSAMLVASLVFYAWWRPEYLALIFVSAITDFHVGARLHGSTQRTVRRRWLLLSLTVNLGLLAFFKYAPLVASTLAPLAERLGVDPARFVLDDWVTPVGISFYTFQTLSYTIDIYRGKLAPCTGFRDFLLYVSLFPQLVAGPIVRAHKLLPQLRERPRLRPHLIEGGCYYVLTGLCLKMVVADNLAPVVRRVFEAQEIGALSALETWLGVVAFGGQIFADFAGYSRIAIGLAMLMGLRFPRNFRYPYISMSLSEFWTRWHITLSEWLRDYLYIPLGGNRKGEARTYVNLMITMLLGGLWHGASWTFLAWGLLHGLGLAVERACGLAGRAAGPGGGRAVLVRAVRILVVFLFVHTAWVLFRAQDFSTALALLERMWIAPFTGSLSHGLPPDWRFAVLLLPILFVHVAQLCREWGGLRVTPNRRALVAATAAFLLIVVWRGAGGEFLYFQF